jgi:hypothetical protein
VGVRIRAASAWRVVLVLILVAAGMLLAAAPRPVRQNQAAVPALLLVRLRLYGKVPVLY